MDCCGSVVRSLQSEMSAAVTDADAGSQQASQIVQLLEAGAVYLTGN